jgi:glycosyltransferase involved in cell wall biosynthesis
MESDNLVSIIIAVFNQENYVVQAIDSALNQEYSNVEVVVVDDGSTDRSYKIIKESFGKSINLIHQKNAGPSAAFNAGIKSSKGDYICLLGGDDLCSPKRVASQLEKILKDNADIIFCRPDIIDQNGKKLNDNVFSNFENKYTTDPPDENPVKNSEFFKELFLYGNTLCAPSALFKKKIISKLGYFDESLIHLQDYDYWLKALSTGIKITFSNQRLVSYRRHSNNLSSETHAENSRSEKCAVLLRVLSYGKPSFLRNCLQTYVFVEKNKNKPLSLFEKSLILLSSPDIEVKRRGYNFFLENINDKSFSYARNNGFDQFRFLLNS